MLQKGKEKQQKKTHKITTHNWWKNSINVENNSTKYCTLSWGILWVGSTVENWIKVCLVSGEKHKQERNLAH